MPAPRSSKATLSGSATGRQSLGAAVSTALRPLVPPFNSKSGLKFTDAAQTRTRTTQGSLFSTAVMVPTGLQKQARTSIPGQ